MSCGCGIRVRACQVGVLGAGAGSARMITHAWVRAPWSCIYRACIQLHISMGIQRKGMSSQ